MSFLSEKHLRIKFNAIIILPLQVISITFKTMKNSLTIYAESEEQLNTIKALMLSLEISFKENIHNDNSEIKEDD